MEKVFESQEELTGYITGKVKGGYICTVDSLPTFMPASQRSLINSGSQRLCAIVQTILVCFVYIIINPCH